MTAVHSPQAGPMLPGQPVEGATGCADGTSTAVNAARAQPVAPHGPSDGDGSGTPPAGRRPGGYRRVVLAAGVAGAALAGGVAALVAPGGSGGVMTVDIRAVHSRFEPDRVSVEPGSTVRFVIHNADPIDHEFIIGPPETHAIHERGEPHLHTGVVPGEVTVPAGATVETTWTFDPAGGPDVAYGCHLAGHWAYGMHGKALVR